MIELGATTCRARSAACSDCPLARWCTSAGRVKVSERRPAGGRPRFEETNRWVRGRVVASLAAGEGLPRDIPEERLAVALHGLIRDGLVNRHGDGHSVG